MPPLYSGSQRVDERVWSVATRSTPAVIQFVLALLLVATWTFGRWPPMGGHDPFLALLLATAVTVAVSLVVAATLFRRDSSTARAIGLSTAASAAVTLIGALTYAFWLL